MRKRSKELDLTGPARKRVEERTIGSPGVTMDRLVACVAEEEKGVDPDLQFFHAVRLLEDWVRGDDKQARQTAALIVSDLAYLNRNRARLLGRMRSVLVEVMDVEREEEGS